MRYLIALTLKESRMTANEFIQSMADAGFDFTFRATNGEMTIVGVVIQEDGKPIIQKQKIRSADDSRAIIKAMFSKNNTAKTIQDRQDSQTKNMAGLAVINNDYAKRKG